MSQRHYLLKTVALPIAATAAAGIACELLDPWLGDTIPFGTFVLAVAGNAVFAGFGAGILTTILCALTNLWFFVDPTFSQNVPDVESRAALALFLFIGLTISILGHLAQRARETAEGFSRRLQATFEHAGIGIVEVEGDDRFVAVNERACRIVGYPRERLLQLNVHELTWPEDRPVSDRMNREVHEGTRDLADYEKRYIRADGSPVWVHVTVSPIRGADGRWNRSITTVEDISERKAAEERLTLAQQAAKIGTFDLDISHDVHEWPSEIAALYGEPEGFVGGIEDWKERIHPADRARASDAVQNAWKAGALDAEWRVIWRDGTERWLAARGKVLRDEGGAPRRLLGINVDITERKRAEEALRESEEAFRAVFEQAAVGMGRVGLTDGRWIDVNAAFCNMLGYTADELRRTSWLEITHADDLEDDLLRFDKMARGELMSYTVEKRFMHKSGRAIWTSSTLSVVRDPQGNPQYEVAIIEDITERKRLEEVVRAALSSAEEANMAKDQFLAVLSHELRTPLTPVLAAVSLLERTGDLSSTGREYLDVIRRNVLVEARLIDDLLDLTRIVRGKLSLDREPVVVQEAVKQAAQVCLSDIELKELLFSVDLPAEPLVVSADSARLQQVFWNLISNAVKFTPKGGWVNIRAYGADLRAIVEVRDGGVGIEAGLLTKVFDAFEQGGQPITRQFGGLGLGLAISKRLVELHGGEVRAESDGVGRGACFRVQLPLAAERLKMDKLTVAVSDDFGWGESSAARILLVEDHADTARLMGTLLKSLGHSVEVAGSVKEGLDAADAQDFDLLISDLGLPDRSGHELMHELRRRGRRINGVAVSGFGREEDVRRSREAGFTEHITKPVDFDLLARVVGRILASEARVDGGGGRTPDHH